MIKFLKVLKPIAGIVCFFVSWQFLMVSELIAWAKEPPRAAAPGQRAPSPAERFGKNLEEIEGLLAKVKVGVDTGKDVGEHVTRVLSLASELDALNSSIEDEFAATGRKLDEIAAAPVIRERQAKALAEYRSKFQETRRLLKSLEKNKAKPAGLGKDAGDLAAFLKANKPKSRHIPLDPNKLPHRAAKAQKILPKQTQEEYEKDERFKPKTKPQHGWNQVLPKDGVKMASASDDFTGMFTVAQASGQPTIPAPTLEDLAPTIDAQFTDAIRAKAAELGNQPLPIYQWVHNNIEFVPTYGSIQGADYCLQTKQCNAFDTASLLISLLRVSGIHARYVYGTIEIPVDKAMNWVGGVTKPELAVQLLNMGGIPAVGVLQGSQFTKIRLEHVWTEAWIDYVPSRGAVHRVGDNWIPMDASWKQYTYTDGVDLAAVVPLDTEDVLNHITSAAHINQAEGWVTGIDSAYVQQYLGAYKSRVDMYVDNHLPDATVGDMIGKKEILQVIVPIFPSALPYKTIVKDGRLANLPASLRHTITLEVKDHSGASEGFSVTRTMPEVAGGRIALSYAPSSSADQAVLNSYLPSPNSDGSPVQTSELPSILPAYLLTLKPELRIDGVVVATGSAAGIGQMEDLVVSITSPNLSQEIINSNAIVGEYNALALVTSKISTSQLSDTRTRLVRMKDKLDARDFSSLTTDDIVGDLLNAGVTSYFAQLDIANEVASRVLGVIVTRLPSFGRFFGALNIEEVFGIPYRVSPGGLSMDIGLIHSVPVSRIGNPTIQSQFMMISGSASSALEHSVPEGLYSTSTTQAKGISAVKALQLAVDQQITVYIIDKSNADSIVPSLQINADAKTDIDNAVSAGKVVTVPKSNIVFNGWTGCGYTVLDPATGSGAYMLSSGMNGGLTFCDRVILGALMMLAFLGAVAIIGLLCVEIAAIVSVMVDVCSAATVAMADVLGAVTDILIDLGLMADAYPLTKALYDDAILWSQMSPPPFPWPGDLPGSMIFIYQYLLFFIFAIKRYGILFLHAGFRYA